MAQITSLLDLPVDTLGDIGAFLPSADRRTLSRVSRGLRRTAVSLWPDDVAVSLKRRILYYMTLDAAFCALVRNALLSGPLAPLPIYAVVEECCNKDDKWKTIAPAAEGFAIDAECRVCGAPKPFLGFPPQCAKVACVAGFHRVDVMGARSLSVSLLASVNTLVLSGCGVSDIACLRQSETLREVVLSRCDHVTALPHIPFLRRAEIRRCRALTSVEALAHAREVVLEECEGVCDVSPLAGVHAVTIARRKGPTDVSALFLGRVHSLVLDSVVIEPLPEGARVHSLTLFGVRVLQGQEMSSSNSSRKSLGYASVDLTRLSLVSLSLCNRPLPSFHSARETPSADNYAPRRGFDVLAATMTSVRLVVNTRGQFDLSWACRLSRVVLEIQSHGAGLSLAPLANVRYVIVRGYVGENIQTVYGLLPAVASVMREAPADVRVQRHGCGALAGRRWSIGFKGDRFRDGSYASTVLAAIASFPTDDEVIVCGLRSLTKMIAPNVDMRSHQCDVEWVAVARACLGREGLPPSCVAAALSMLFEAAASAYCSPGDDGARGLIKALPLGDMARAAVRAARSWPDHVAVLEAAAHTFELIAWMPRLAGRRMFLDMHFGYWPSWTSRASSVSVFPEVDANMRQDRSWVSTAIEVALALAQRFPFDRSVPSVQLPMDLLAAVADIDRSCARALVEAGVLDMLFERAAARLNSHSKLADDSWIGPLGRLAEYACDDADTHAPALVSADAMLDVARRLSRWAIVDRGYIELLELLLAGVSPFPPRQRVASYVDQSQSREELILGAMNRHRFDCDFEVASALAYNCVESRCCLHLRRAVLARLSTYVARSPHLEQHRALEVLSQEGSATAIGRAGGGFAFLSAVIRASLSHECDSKSPARERKHLCNFAEALCVLVASGEVAWCTDAVDTALENCVACLGTERLWDPDHRSCLHDIARAASLLLFGKCRPDCNAVAPATLCALAATAAMGFRLKPLERRTTDLVELRDLHVSVMAIGEYSTCEEVRASRTLLLQTAGLVFPEYEMLKGRREGRQRVAAVVGHGAVVSDAHVARSLLTVVARGGLSVAATTRVCSPADRFVAPATILALCAMDGQQRASLVEDVSHTMHALRRLCQWTSTTTSLEVQEAATQWTSTTTSLEVQEAYVGALDELQKLCCN